jgi:hypothetical protein
MKTTATRYTTIIEKNAYMNIQNKGFTNILQKKYRLQLQYSFLYIINLPK